MKKYKPRLPDYEIALVCGFIALVGIAFLVFYGFVILVKLIGPLL